MVDTINPQTGKSDEFSGGGQANPTSQPQIPQPDNFYAGFGKAQDIHVNLASSGDRATSNTPTAPISTPAPEVTTPAVSKPEPSFSNPTPASQPQATVHQTYNASAGSLNWRLLLLVGGVGIVAVMLVGVITSVITGSVNNGRLEKEKQTLEALTTQLNQLKTPPEQLTLPVTQKPETNTPTPEPPKVDETPTTTPPVTVPTTTGTEKNPVGMG